MNYTNKILSRAHASAVHDRIENETNPIGVYQSQIAKDLGLPRTVVFYWVHRLEAAGLIRTTRIGSNVFCTIARRDGQ